MTIARHRARSFDAAIAVAPPTAPAPSVQARDAYVVLGDAPAPEINAPLGRLRRCTYRRIDRALVAASRSAAVAYEVKCLYVDRDAPLSLGDVDSAQPICHACSAPGIFRPDED